MRLGATPVPKCEGSFGFAYDRLWGTQRSYGVEVQIWAQFFVEDANTILDPYLVFDQLRPSLLRYVPEGLYPTLGYPNASGTLVVISKKVVNSRFFWEQKLRLTKCLQKRHVQHSQLRLILPFE